MRIHCHDISGKSVSARTTAYVVATPILDAMMRMKLMHNADGVNRIFQAENIYLGDVLDETQVVSTFNNALVRDMTKDDWGVLSRHEISFPKAEVLCVFLRPNLPLEAMSQLRGKDQNSFIQNALKSAKSSVVIPHTMREFPLRTALAFDANSYTIGVEYLEDFIASPKGKTLLSDGKTDLLVVQISDQHSLAETDALVKSASEILLAATNGLTDFALTGDEAEPNDISSPLNRRLSTQVGEVSTGSIVCEAGYLVGHTSDGTPFCFSHYVNMTPEVLTGLLFGFFFIFLAYVGLSVLHSIQTPTRYPHHGPPRGKEF